MNTQCNLHPCIDYMDGLGRRGPGWAEGWMVGWAGVERNRSGTMLRNLT